MPLEVVAAIAANGGVALSEDAFLIMLFAGKLGSILFLVLHIKKKIFLILYI